jgi:hypothetical protein
MVLFGSRARDRGRRLHRSAQASRLRQGSGLVVASVGRARRSADRVRDRAPARARRPRSGGWPEVGRPASASDRAARDLARRARHPRPRAGPRPEAPLIALGLGLGALAMRSVKKDAPDQAVSLMAAAGSFAAVASIFGSPVIGAVLILEASGLGGATLPLVLLPGLVAAGIGSLVFIGLGSFSGFSTAAWALSPFPLPSFGGPGWGDFAWTIALSIVAAAGVFAVLELARWSKRLVDQHVFFLTIAAGLAVGGFAIAFAEAAGESPNAVLFSGEEAFGSLFASSQTIALSTLALLMLFKGLAWSVSLGSFRGGPTFPVRQRGTRGRAADRRRRNRRLFDERSPYRVRRHARRRRSAPAQAQAANGDNRGHPGSDARHLEAPYGEDGFLDRRAFRRHPVRQALRDRRRLNPALSGAVRAGCSRSARRRSPRRARRGTLAVRPARPRPPALPRAAPGRKAR